MTYQERNTKKTLSIITALCLFLSLKSGICLVDNITSTYPICSNHTITPQAAYFPVINGTVTAPHQCFKKQISLGTESTYYCIHTGTLNSLPFVSNYSCNDYCMFKNNSCDGMNISTNFSTDCLCTASNVTSTDYCIVNGILTNVNLTYVLVNFCYMVKAFIPPAYNNAPFQDSVSSKKREIFQTSVISFNMPVITIITPANLVGTIMVSWNYMSNNGWDHVVAGVDTVVLSQTMFRQAGILMVMVTLNDTIDHKTYFSVPLSDTCVVACYLCTDTFTKWPCLSVGYQFLVVLIISALGLVAFTSLYCAIKIIYPCLNCAPRSTINNFLNPQDKDDSKERLEQDLEIALSVWDRIAARGTPKISGNMIVIMLLALPIVLADDVSNNINICYNKSIVESCINHLGSCVLNNVLSLENSRNFELYKNATSFLRFFLLDSKSNTFNFYMKFQMIALFPLIYLFFHFFGKMYNKISKIREQVCLTFKTYNVENLEVEKTSQSIDKIKYKDYSTAIPPLMRSLLTLFLVIMFLSSFPMVSSQQCTSGLMISSSASTCSVSGTVQTCSFSQDSLISLPFIGGTACISYVSTLDQSVMGTSYLTFDQLLRTVSLQSGYFTAKWQLVSSSSCVCYNSFGCSGNECSIFNGTPIDGFSHSLSGPSLNLPGLTICTSQCGCAGCGCFFCDAKCCYSRFGVQPTGPTYQVLFPITSVITPVINATSIHNSTRTETLISLTGAVTTLTPFLTATIIGSLSGGVTEFGTRAIIEGPSSVYYGPAAAPNALALGLPGDIQGPTSTSFSNPGINGFNFPLGIATPQFGSSGTTYTAQTSGVEILTSSSQYLTLPALIGSTLYSFSNGQLIGMDNNPGAVLMQLTSSTPLVLTKTVFVVCPSITTTIVINGCYNCLNNARFSFSAKSTCSVGIALASVISSINITILTPQVTLPITTATTHTVEFFTATKSISGSLKLCSGTFCDTVAFVGVLDDPPPIIPVNQSQAPVSFPPLGSGTPDFATWFNGLVFPWDIVKWVVVSVIIVSVFAGIFLACYLGYFLYQKYMPLTITYQSI